MAMDPTVDELKRLQKPVQFKEIVSALAETMGVGA
jgi:hypothetical protein